MYVGNPELLEDDKCMYRSTELREKFFSSTRRKSTHKCCFPFFFFNFCSCDVFCCLMQEAMKREKLGQNTRFRLLELRIEKIQTNKQTKKEMRGGACALRTRSLHCQNFAKAIASLKDPGIDRTRPKASGHIPRRSRPPASRR